MSRTLAITLIALALAVSAPVLADGMIFPLERPHSTVIIPDQLFTVKYHHVNVIIDGQLCTTKVDQIFHNDTSVEREGMYIFPMPEGSTITKFSMFAGEEEIVGKVLGKDEARDIYESIVRQRKDPAILEYIDRNTFRARVYPIPANGDKRIKLSYAEVAGKSGNAFRYVYPLSTERFSAKPLEDCRVTIKLRAKRAITNIYSPTHPVKIERTADNEATVTWEVRDTRPDTDLVLYYSVSDSDLGMDLIAHKGPSGQGYFMLLASPRTQIDKAKVQPKNVVFVLDRTGSMAGEKIDQAKAALKFCLNSLRDNDQFNVINFNETTDTLFAELEKPTPGRRKKALSAVDAIEATGGTNVNGALEKAMSQFREYGKTQNYVVFITDGLPTVGETNVETILKNASSANKNKVKVFAFGVGYDVNTHLLDKLAEQHHGATDYVRPREDIEAKVSAFFSRVSEPILGDVAVKISGVKTSDMFPSKDIPDVFRGSQLVVFGRYDGSGDVKVTLSGIAGSAPKTFVLNASLPNSESSNEFIPQLWAVRKIGYLLDEIRLHNNKELVDEVVRLSKEYGIPTEYTSFLADERKTDVALHAEMKRVQVAPDAASKVQSGKGGIAQSANASASRQAAQMPASAPTGAHGGGYGGASVVGTIAANGRIGGSYQDEQDRTVIVANVQNIARRTFYQRGAFWEDANLVPNQKLVQIKQFSDAHFKLLKAYPKLSQYSTLGNVRAVLENGQALEIGPEGKGTMSDAEMNALLKGVPRG